ncbi:MAG: phosphoglucosamine mutase [Thermoguttaceae bacterium]
MSEPIISVSGLRGVVGDSLTPEVALRYVAALAAVAPPGPIIVARDGRPSGEMLSGAVHTGLQAAGRDTLEAGIAATPTAGVLVRHLRAAGAVQITASHNPAPYNGLKLFSAEGRVLPAAPGREILARYRQADTSWAPHDRLGNGRELPNTLSAHVEAVLATVDVKRIRQRRFRVLLDSNHGAGSLLGWRLLENLGCEFTILGDAPDGQFEHLPEPTAENLDGVRSAVTQFGADVGFCQDPDADRLAVIDRSGRYLGEEYTLALCVDHVLRHARGPIVTNCSTSRMSQDLAERAGASFFRSAVGEANVVDCMLAHGALFGGEGNGGPIDPRVGLVRDSFVGMARLLDMMAERERTIGELADALPRYKIVKTKVSLLPERVPAGLEALGRHFAAAAADRLDGLRLDWPGRWLLVRPSNTEPIVRIVAEAATAAEAQRLCSEAAEVLAE